jgi:A/G-specific adenine glycosylase
VRRTPKLVLPIEPAQWAQSIIEWFRANRRDLPWRRDPDPYKVWLSEVMLQQTQVKTVIPYFEKFIATYPSLQDLAKADEDEVLDLWAGLGYYRRARNLHAAARVMCREFGGRFPETFEELLSLPGIGRYSAGAILSIARGQPHPVLDGNVKRVLSRCLALREPVPDSALWHLLAEVVALPDVAGAISAFNQGLMELGAVICTPKGPDCGSCPVASSCGAHRLGVESDLPVSRGRTRAIEETYTVTVIVREGRYLMHRNDRGPFLRGFWEFPRLRGRFESAGALSEKLEQEFDLGVRPGKRIAEIRHQITFRRLTFVAVGATLSRDPADPRWRWLCPGQQRHPMSAYVRKVFAAGWPGSEGRI